MSYNWSGEASTWSPDSEAGGGGDECSSSTFFFVIYGPLYGLVCAFGLVGNSLSLAVLHKYSRNTVATFLLEALAVSDNIFLATAALVQMYTAMSMHHGQTEQLERLYPRLQMLAWPLVHIVQMSTVWMMVLVAGNRYIAVCRPLHAQRLCVRSHVQRQIAALCAAIVVYNVPRFLEYKYETQPRAGNGTGVELERVNVGLTSYRAYNIVYENVAYCLFVFLLPLVILVFFNVHLVCDLKRAQRVRVLTGRVRTAEETNITLVMVVVVIVFIVCQMPASINQVLYFVVDTQPAAGLCSHYSKYFHVSNLLIVTNSSVNFIIYCVFRRQFQQEVRALLCRSSVGVRRGRGALRKTVLLRALHERTSCTYLTRTQSGGSGRGRLVPDDSVRGRTADRDQCDSDVYTEVSCNARAPHDREAPSNTRALHDKEALVITRVPDDKEAPSNTRATQDEETLSNKRAPNCPETLCNTRDPNDPDTLCNKRAPNSPETLCNTRGPNDPETLCNTLAPNDKEFLCNKRGPHSPETLCNAQVLSHTCNTAGPRKTEEAPDAVCEERLE